jgi:hypothetical protein
MAFYQWHQTCSPKSELDRIYRMYRIIFAFLEEIISADFTDVADYKKPSAKGINAFWSKYLVLRGLA